MRAIGTAERALEMMCLRAADREASAGRWPTSSSSRFPARPMEIDGLPAIAERRLDDGHGRQARRPPEISMMLWSPPTW